MKFPAAVTADEIPFATNPVRDDWRLLDDVQLLSLPDPQFLIAGILQAKSVAVIYGPPATGKTTLTASMLASIASRRNWHGYRVIESGPSVCVAAEDPPGFKQRTGAKQQAGLPLDRVIGVHTFPAPFNLLERGEYARFVRLVKDSGIDPVVVNLDTCAATTSGGNENSSEDTTTAMTNVQYMRDELGATFILTHHTNAAGSRERGHSAMRGAADTMIQVTATDDYVTVECSKQRNGPMFEPIKLKLVTLDGAPGMVFRPFADVLPSAKPSPLQAKLLTVLTDAPADGLTNAAWKASTPDVQERSFYRAVARLEQLGCVRKNGTYYIATGWVGHED
jgi:hypothetical protein